jgi:formylmethanofuran dehydrogenase subunit D
MNPETDGTGMPSLKGLPAKIESAPKEKILNVYDLLTKYYQRN